MGCGGEDAAEVTTPPATLAPELLSLYDYDPAALEVEEVKSEQRDGAVIHDLSYAGPEGRITAYYVTPQGDGPFPAVVFMHGSRRPSTARSRCHFVATAAADPSRHCRQERESPV